MREKEAAWGLARAVLVAPGVRAVQVAQVAQQNFARLVPAKKEWQHENCFLRRRSQRSNTAKEY